MTWLRDFIAAWSAVIGPELRRAVEPHTDFAEPDKPLPVDLPDEHETL